MRILYLAHLHVRIHCFTFNRFTLCYTQHEHAYNIVTKFVNTTYFVCSRTAERYGALNILIHCQAGSSYG